MVNWHSYNESLVRRGEVVLDFDVIDNWNNELDNMNNGKEGASYRYPDSFVELIGYMRVYFHLPYRQTEGVVNKAHSNKKVLENALENNTLKKVIADGAYDNKENFQYLLDKNIDAAIKVRKNSSYDRSIGCYSRKIAVLKQLKNFEKWKTKVSYSSRWIAETVFSSLKRMFGEHYIRKKIFKHGQRDDAKSIVIQRVHSRKINRKRECHIL